jgi:nucleotide-sensitive chloride channel 1A
VLAFAWPSGVGFTIEYPRITLHAVSRGESGPSVYCQLDESAQGPGAPGADEEQDDSEMREMKIIPSNPESGE